MIPSIKRPESCPLDGYADLAVEILANPTFRFWREWEAKQVETPGCKACQALREPKVARGRRRKAAPVSATEPTAFCASCAEKRANFGRMASAIYGPEL